MKKIIFFLTFVFYSSISLAQSTKIKPEELLDMYRTWVKALLFIIVVLSIVLLVLFLKYAKLKQSRKECCK